MEEENNSEIDKYFTWEPEREKKDKEKIVVTEVKINPIEKYLNKRSSRGINVSGLIKLLMKEDIDENNSPEEYVIKFNGRMKMNNNFCDEKKEEIEEAVRHHYSEISRNSMRKKRDKIYKEQVEKYFPREELEKKLDSTVEYKTNNITPGILKGLINDILNKKGVPIQEQKSITYRSRFWIETFNKFMLERGYTKKWDKYVKKQE